MENISLEISNYIELAELLEIANIKHLVIKPVEAKLLLDLEEPVNHLSDFDWNITASVIEGRVSGSVRYFPLSTYAEEWLGELNWHPKAITAASLAFIVSKLTAQEILEKIQSKLYEDFDYLSHGQAKTVIKRYIGATLTSSERNDITKISQKIDSCRKMIQAFEGMLSKRDLDMSIRKWETYQRQEPPQTKELVEKSLKSLQFMCFECKTHVAFSNSVEAQPVDPPMHHGKPMVLNWNAKFSPEENTAAHRELEEVLNEPKRNLTSIGQKREKNITGKSHDLHLYCTVCHEFQEIEDELAQKILNTDYKVELPYHHEKEMEIRVGKRLSDPERYSQLKNMMSSMMTKPDSLGFFLCEECGLIIEFDDDEEYTPQHHGKDMVRIQVGKGKSKNKK